MRFVYPVLFLLCSFSSLHAQPVRYLLNQQLEHDASIPEGKVLLQLFQDPDSSYHIMFTFGYYEGRMQEWTFPQFLKYPDEITFVNGAGETLTTKVGDFRIWQHDGWMRYYHVVNTSFVAWFAQGIQEVQLHEDGRVRHYNIPLDHQGYTIDIRNTPDMLSRTASRK